MSRFLRVRVLPWVIWIGTMGAAAWLWQGVHGGSARGFVETHDHDVAASETARLESVLVTAGQRVRAGQVIATLDARELGAELEILAAERRRVEAELGAVTSDTELRLGDTSRQIAESLAANERALQTHRAARAVHAAEFTALNHQLEVLRGPRRQAHGRPPRARRRRRQARGRQEGTAGQRRPHRPARRPDLRRPRP
jgi:multidrug efflux pump subunit AcrA (membrane-fusion protein)